MTVFTASAWQPGLGVSGEYAGYLKLQSHNISGLDVVLVLLNLLLESIEGDLIIFNNQVDLQLLDTETNGNELGTTPDKTILLNSADTILEFLHVGLIV